MVSVAVGCVLPACCCQPAIAGGVIYADLRGELSTHLSLQALFTQSSVCEPLLQAFPFQSTLGEVKLHHAFSGLRVCLQLTWEVGLLPPPVEFSSHHHFYKLSHSWLLGSAAAPACHMWEVGLPPSPVEFSSLHHSHKFSRSWLLGMRLCSCQSLSGPPGLFIYSSGKDSLPPTSALSVPQPLSCVSLLFLLLITQFLFFPLVEVGLSRGLCCSGLGLSVGVPR
jgi:hypothetical protein